jgi:hypothetical protein
MQQSAAVISSNSVGDSILPASGCPPRGYPLI